MAHEEYLRRNLLVAKAEGAKAAVSVALKRLEMQTRPPRWLVKSLNATLVRLDPLPHDLAMWRDMALDAPEFVRGKETKEGCQHVYVTANGVSQCAYCLKFEVVEAR